MAIGFDFSWGNGKPSAAAIKAAGGGFGVSYLSTADRTKGWTSGQVSELRGHQVGVCAVWENGNAEALHGHAAGQQAALAATSLAQEFGRPEGRPIYFAVDTDTDWGSVRPYFEGVRSVLSKDETGIYAGYRVILGAQSSGLVGYFWQTVAWSGGKVAPGIHLYQRLGTTKVGGVGCDVDECFADDYGQWFGVPVSGRSQLLEDDMAMVQLKSGFGADVNGDLLADGSDNVTVAFTNGPQSAGVGAVYGYLYCDIGTAKVRVAFHGPKGWRIEHVTVDHLATPCQPVHPQEGESHCSIARMPLDADDIDSANVPLGYGTNVFAP